MGWLPPWTGADAGPEADAGVATTLLRHILSLAAGPPPPPPPPPPSSSWDEDMLESLRQLAGLVLTTAASPAGCWLVAAIVAAIGVASTAYATYRFKAIVSEVMDSMQRVELLLSEKDSVPDSSAGGDMDVRKLLQTWLLTSDSAERLLPPGPDGGTGSGSESEDLQP